MFSTRQLALISHASKVMLKILQARLHHYVNLELPDVQAGFRKGRGTRDKIANIHWIIEKAREFQKNIYFCFIDYVRAFDSVNHNKLWKTLKEMGIPDHLTCLLRNQHSGQEAKVRTLYGATDWFKIERGVWQGCILSPCLFNLYAEFSSVQSLSRVRLFATPWTAACQASLSITNPSEFTQIHVHWVGDAIQPSHPLLSPSSPAFNLSQHQDLFKWVSSSQSTSCKMLGWMKHKLESRLPGEISITSDTQMTPPLWQKVKRN